MRTLVLSLLLAFGGIQALQAWDPVVFGDSPPSIDTEQPTYEATSALVVLIGERDVLSSFLPLRVENRGRRIVHDAEVTCASKLWLLERTVFTERVERIQGPGVARLRMPAADATARMTCDVLQRTV